MFPHVLQQPAQLIVQSFPYIKWSGPPPTVHCTGSAYAQWELFNTDYITYINGASTCSSSNSTINTGQCLPFIAQCAYAVRVEMAFKRVVITSVSLPLRIKAPRNQIFIKILAKAVWKRMCASYRVDVISALIHQPCCINYKHIFMYIFIYIYSKIIDTFLYRWN